MKDKIFEGLNDEQRSAVETTRGPVCILAGAGSGKTTTITRRIANQVATEAFGVREILAVSFTDKAAAEMARRLERLGIPGIRAKTFHAEALAQFRRLGSDESEIIAAKAPIISSLVRALPPPHKFTALRDVATEIEWAKNRRIRPESYLGQLSEHRPPIPAEMMAGIYASYEKRKSRAKLMDFEDLLERTIEFIQSNANALDAIRIQYKAFTVDEYQDVNLLQETLLRTWLGNNQEICVVGDDYQSIFGFTGATPRYLLQFAERFSNCRQVQLTINYRSTPAILAVANRLVPKLGGSKKTLRPAVREGVAPVVRSFSTGDEEVEWIVSEARRLHAQGMPWEEMAVLYRINARSGPFEDAFSRHKIPFQVRDSVFLRRPAARDLLARLKRATGPLVDSVTNIALKLGYNPGSDEVDGDEATRQADLERLIRLAEEYPGQEGIPGFIADLEARFRPESEGRGINLLTYHRAKGLEFRAVFLPRLEDRELPFALADGEQLSEERRLFYVGITRAKERLLISWALYREDVRAKRRRKSPFLDEIDQPTSRSVPPRPTRARGGTIRREVSAENAALFEALKQWRLQESRRAEVPAYVVFADETLARISELRPRDLASLLGIPGIGPKKASLYGTAVLTLVAEHPDK